MSFWSAAALPPIANPLFGTHHSASPVVRSSSFLSSYEQRAVDPWAFDSAPEECTARLAEGFKYLLFPFISSSLPQHPPLLFRHFTPSPTISHHLPPTSTFTIYLHHLPPSSTFAIYLRHLPSPSTSDIYFHHLPPPSFTTISHHHLSPPLPLPSSLAFSFNSFVSPFLLSFLSLGCESSRQ